MPLRPWFNTGFLNGHRVLASVNVASMADYRSLHEQGFAEVIQQRALAREPEWCEALAVGNRHFVERVSTVYEARLKFVYTEAGIEADQPTWTIHEDLSPYRPILGAKTTV